MTNDQILSTCKDVATAINDGRLYDAYSTLISLSDGKLWWELTEKLKEQEQSYRMMLDYAVKGAEDPGRSELYVTLQDKLYTLLDIFRRRVAMIDTPSSYFNTLRYEGRQASDTIASLLDKLREMRSSGSLLDMIADGKSQESVDRRSIEDVEKRIFDRIWVSFPLNDDTTQAIDDAMHDASFDDKFKRLIIGALMLGQIQYNDRRRLQLLLGTYRDATSSRVSMAALTAAIIGISAHPQRPMHQSIKDMIEALRDTTTWSTDVRNVYIELRVALDTDRITRKLNDEVLPQIMKLRPDIAKKINELDGLDVENLEENPEWNAMWDRSGIGAKLREISELHEQGADVMMGAFAQLKSYPFFHDVANWFRAFDTGNSHLKHISDNRELLDLIEMSAGMCDSDKYSLGLSMGSLPDAQKRALSAHLAAQSQQIEEVKLASLTTDRDNRRSDAADFIHDIYRFFRLYRRKGDFTDPFDGDIFLNDIAILRPDVDDVDTLLLLVNLGLKGQQWQSVINLLQRLRDIGEATEQNFQQMGYCYQRLGEYKQAIECYNQAALIDGTNSWTISRLAASHRMAGNPAEALRYYREIEKSQPDDLKLAMNIGYTLLELGKDNEAAEYFYKVDVLDEKSHRALRPLAWSLLRSRQLEQAETYYKRILENEPTADDYLNMGHLALVSRRMSDAVNFYRLYIDMKDGDISTFVKAFLSDAESLAVMGVDPLLPPLILDHIRYTQK